MGSSGKVPAIDWLNDAVAQELSHIGIHNHGSLLQYVSAGIFVHFLVCVILLSWVLL